MTDLATVKVYACTPEGHEFDQWPVSFRTTWMHDYDTGWEVEVRWHRIFLGRHEITRPIAVLMFGDLAVEEIEAYAARELLAQRFDILEAAQ
jgi:hypothetical protein